MIRRVVAWLAVAFAGLGLAWISGNRSGAMRGRNKALRKANDNLKTAIEVRNATDAKTDAATRNDLSRWVRPE